MTDEKMTPEPGLLPFHLVDNAKRVELAGRLADVMQTELERRVTDPDTETHEIITKAKEQPTMLKPNNLGPVLKAMRRHDSKHS